MAFVARCPIEHAFSVWTDRITTWWPADHTASGESGLQIAIEPRLGGRTHERTRSEPSTAMRSR